MKEANESNFADEPLVFVAEQIEMIPAELLKERRGNSKKHPPEQVARLAGAIREFGFTVPLLIDARNGIVAGHGRKLAGVAVGMRRFPCVRVDHLAPAQVAALVLFDNKIADTGFDPALLRVEIEGLRGLDEELLGLTGFTDAELDALSKDLEPEKPGKEEKKAPEIRFGPHKIQVSLPELQALEGLVEIHLSKFGDLVGFVEKTLLNPHQDK